MVPVIALHYAVAAGAPWIFRRWGRASFLLLAAVPALSLVWLVFQHGLAYGGAQGGGLAETYQFVPALHFDIAFRIDPLAWVMELLVLGIGALVLAHCSRYFKDDDDGLGGFGGQLLAFAGTMFGLVAADDLVSLYVFWEITSVLSFLLIGFARTRLAARRSAVQALIVTTAGGLAMLVGIVMIGTAAGTYRISEILAKAGQLTTAPGTSGVVAAGALLLLVGALSKSALVPFHFWLPAAMSAPAPVSAYLHAAAMVKAGVYLVARLAPGFADTPFWRPVVLGLGAATLVIGGYRALRQTDIKLLLAFGTVSQLGFMVAVVGLGTPAAALAGLALVVAHALFKAALFLIVGIVDHQTGTRDLRRLSGLYRRAPRLAVLAALAAASMAGLPLFGGFVAKESIFAAFTDAFGAEGPLSALVGVAVLAALVVGSALTVAYSARFVWGTFARKPGLPDTNFKPVTPLFLAAPLVLAVLGLVYGVWPAAVDAWVRPYALAGSHLSGWHGFELPLALSAAAWAGGALLFWARDPVYRLQAALSGLPDAERAYRGMVGAVDDAAIWVTGRTQRGSLFFYLAVILSVATLLPLVVMLLTRPVIPGSAYFIDPNSPLQAVIGVGIVIGALAAVRANKRFLAVLMVSVTGYGIALIFALQGAPDLAMTQLLVETIVLVAFVLGLRRLPAQLRDRTGGAYRVTRVIIAVLFGTVIVFAGMFAMSARTDAPISLRFPDLAYSEGGGTNIVNVTLVDIRAWDTFGEISVLVLAATGIASLIFISHRGRHPGPTHEVETGSVGRVRGVDPTSRGGAELAVARTFASVERDAWLLAGRTLAPERRSIVFEVITRLVFHSMVLFSLYLLLAGHNAPGGGFAGGLVAGIALTIRYLAGGRFELHEAAPFNPGILLGAGLATAALSAAVPLLVGGQILQSAIISLWLPVFGDVKFVTSTIFDIGVYLIVVALVIDVLRSLGSRVDEQLEDHAHAEAARELRARSEREQEKERA